MISAICLTYGRVDRLNEALQCFLDQTCAEKELIILNTFPKQQLAFDHPQVRVINCTERPPSLGAARNMAIEAATGPYLVTTDDDDLYLPWHLQAYADAFAAHKTE